MSGTIDYQVLRAVMEAEFNARFDKAMANMRTAPRGLYAAVRTIAFEWYLSGFFDALIGEDGNALARGLLDACEGRTKSLAEVRAGLKKGGG